MSGVKVLPNGAIAEAASQMAWFLPILLGTVALFNYNSELRITDQSSEEIANEYDFIIVGAGSAGENNIILFYYYIIIAHLVLVFSIAI